MRLRDITLANWLQVVELTLDVQEETRRLPSRGHPLRAPILRLGSPPIFRSPTHVHDNFRQTYPLLTALAPRTLKKQNLGFSGFLDAGSQIQCKVRSIRIQLSMHVVCLRNPGTVSLQRLQRRWRADLSFYFSLMVEKERKRGLRFAMASVDSHFTYSNRISLLHAQGDACSILFTLHSVYSGLAG